MIEVDGSHGEGGGQIIRTAVALSAVTKRPVKVINIRKSRPKPGLAAQHAQAIQSLAVISSAKVDGAAPGSPEVSFYPGEVQKGSYRIDIGTAGSITLLLQCLLPAVIHADGPVTLEVNGGTDVKWSPTLDYFKEVFLPAASLFGVQASLTLSRRGYYPRGGGQAELVVRPGKLKPAKIVDSSSCQVLGRSHCSNLPSHVPTRQASAAASILKAAGCEVEISTDVRELPSTGSGITLWSGHKGASALGERGVRAENVGRKAAEDMVRELSSPAAVDIHLADQLIPYLAMAGGSYTVREVSEHARTNIWTVNHFFEKEIIISGQEIFRIEAQPESN